MKTISGIAAVLFCTMGTMAASGDISFGRNFAVLMLDEMQVLVNAIEGMPGAQSFVNSTASWLAAVHQQIPQPLTIFTSLYFSKPSYPELAPDAPFTHLISGFGNFAKGSPGVQIAREFQLGKQDIVLQKTRWYAGAGNGLEEILRAQNVDAVVISGLSLSGVVLSTCYRLFDLDYKIYVISDNVYQIPLNSDSSDNTISEAILTGILPQMRAKVISLDEAVMALSSSA